MKMQIRDDLIIKSMVMQPTTPCQLDCNYCYLPDRKLNKKMELSVVMATIQNLLDVPVQYLAEEITVFWHSGEPLLRGIDFYNQALDLFREFEKVRDVRFIHCIQTNAVCIDDAWCDFVKTQKVRLGVSVDGPAEMNSERVFYNKKAAWDKIYAGIETLMRNGVEFSTISVLSSTEDEYVAAWFEFITKIQSQMVGVNFQEKLLVSTVSAEVDIQLFWKKLFDLWSATDYAMPMRELIRAYHIISDEEQLVSQKAFDKTDLFVGISYDGNISLLSPEFIEITKSENQFIVGNVCTDDNLVSVIERIRRGEVAYFNEFVAGVEMCRAECEYFNFCGGGSAANKFYENGSLTTTRTKHCEGQIIYPVETLVNHFS